MWQKEEAQKQSATGGLWSVKDQEISKYVFASKEVSLHVNLRFHSQEGPDVGFYGYQFWQLYKNEERATKNY